MPERYRAVQLGLGPIGIESAQLAGRSGRFDIVGAVDVDPALTGRPLADLLGTTGGGPAVEPDLAAVLARTRPDIVFQTTGSRLARVMEQIETVLGHGANLVSTAEELLYPHRRHPREARRIDDLARRHGVTVLGTGVNPGFAMDTLPLCLSGVCRRVDAVHVRRVVDATTRRGPLQRKIGAGLTEAEFRTRASRGEIGHVGLVESLDLLAAGLGLHVDTVDEQLDPVIARTEITTAHVTVRAGRVSGIHHVATGKSGAESKLVLELWMHMGAEQPIDEVRIDGEPAIRSTIDGGIAGDAATVAMLVNGASRVIAAGPGLKTMIDIPIVGWRAPAHPSA